MSLHRRRASQVWHIDFTLHGVRHACSSRTMRRELAASMERRWRKQILAARTAGTEPGTGIDAVVRSYLRAFRYLGTARTRGRDGEPPVAPCEPEGGVR